MARFYMLCGYAAGACILTIAIAILIQIAGRLVDANLFGLVEVSTYAMVGATFVALPYTLKTGGHIRVFLLLGATRGRPRWILEFACYLVTLVFVAIFFYFCLDLVLDSYRRGARSQGMLSSPLWIPQALMTGGLFLFGIALVDGVVALLKNGKDLPDGSAGTSDRL